MTDGPITAEELMRRGVSDEIEGRALDVVLRLGWPRPGDPLGIKPCAPVPADELFRAREDLLKEGPNACQRLLAAMNRWLNCHETVRVTYAQTAEEAEEGPST